MISAEPTVTAGYALIDLDTIGAYTLFRFCANELVSGATSVARFSPSDLSPFGVVLAQTIATASRKHSLAGIMRGRTCNPRNTTLECGTLVPKLVRSPGELWNVEFAR